MRALPLFLAVAILAAAAGCTLRLPPTPGGPEPGPAPLAGKNLTVHFISVGQGDSALVVTPQGKTLLFDAGPSPAADDIIAYLDSLGVGRLDVFVASHGDADHIGGVGRQDPNVLLAHPAEVVYDPGYPKTTQTYRIFLETVDAINATYHTAADFAPGHLLPLDPAVAIRFLHPELVNEKGEPNDEGILLRLAYGNVSVLLPGDASSRVESELLGRGEPVDSTLLKVGHHGSRGSTSAAWLAAVTPQVGILSLGNNTYGHPHPEALARLEAAGVPTFRTDQQGTLVFTTDGTTWTLRKAGVGSMVLLRGAGP